MSFQKDVVHLSNSGPAISGSQIVFKAEVSDGTSHPVQDEKYLEYSWENTADGLKRTTKGHKNTTLKSCYQRRFTPPRQYKMTVTVRDIHDIIPKFVGRAESHFRITEQLNGNLNASQELKYREPEAAKVYSTKEPIQLHLNLTDKFMEAPSIDYSWFLDGNFSMVTNSPETTLLVSEAGEHTVEVKVKSVNKVPDCDDFIDNIEITGHFSETVILKDPVEVNVSGAAAINKTEPIVINVTLNGSDPFTVCWNSSLTSGMACIDDWCCQNVTNITDYNITVGSQPIGQYFFNISVSNDVSIVFKEHNVSVEEPPPQPLDHNAASVVLPVIGGLLAVCFILAGVIYVLKVRKKKRVEVADFDFHPLITRTDSYRRSLTENIKYTFQRMFRRNKYEQTHRHPSYAAPQSMRYGSLEETSAKESLFETL